MRAARSWGVAPSVLRGNRLPGERWTEQDTALAVALQLHEDDLCPDCGQPRSESMDPGAERVGGSGPHFYEVPPPARCHSCDEIAQEVEKVAAGDVTLTRPQALRWRSLKTARG